ncbi:MAG: hypothetical protein UV73_C0008G0038 [Candidatus Gottesmanbacteria bacterium GW2011_GWA2_43_14]|uniref:Uncharacterized protein n=1 Tax=Candidatus Gottesmanbacteria bacterium GW2011_GWA2_43_14 TaxID=1618443 RepID=A0A0G1GF75_9BACT|nr:MAG: hypothetical protein UV73_C0008G0038 [Candidatus Gottesmanbacteria bacterium GW2011_GWA2_43_14]
MKFLLFFFFLFSVFLPKDVMASDLDLTCNDSGCTPATVSDFFPADKWYPGKEIVKTFRIQNTSGSKKQAALGSYDESSTGGMPGAMSLTVQSVPSLNTIWTGTFEEVFANDEISLGEIEASEVKDYRLVLVMDESSGNNLQDQSLSFSLKIGLLEAAESPTSTPPSPSLTPTPPGGQPVSAFSRFVIRTALNRSVVTIAPAPVLGVEEARQIRPVFNSISPWLSPLFRGVSCHISYWGLIGFAIQLLLSLTFVKIYRRKNFQIIALALALFMVLTVAYALNSTCFSFLPLFWLGLGILSLSVYLVILSHASVKA